MKKVSFLKTAVIVLVLINLITISVILYRHFNHSGHHHFRGKRHHERIIKTLDLTDEQKDRFKAMRRAHKKDMESFRNDIGELRYQQIELVKSGYNEKAADSLASEIARNQKAIELSTMKHFSELKEMLSPQQQDKFDNLADRFAEKLKHKPHRFHR